VWPDTYNEEERGFAVPLADNGHLETFEMMLLDEERAHYGIVFPADDKLRIMKDTPEARFIEKPFIT
jgi:hypothetical protein